MREPIEILIKAQTLTIETHLIRAHEKRTLDARDRHAAWVAGEWDRAGVPEDQRKGIQPPGIDRTMEIDAQFNSLRIHRLYVVRPHSRSTHLARTYLRGDPYQKAEAYAMTRPNFDEVFSIVKRFAPGGAPQLVAQAFEQWKQAADGWHKSRPAQEAYFDRCRDARIKRRMAVDKNNGHRLAAGKPVTVGRSS